METSYNFFNTAEAEPKGEEVFERALETSLKDFDDDVLIQNLESKKKFLSQTTRRYNEQL